MSKEFWKSKTFWFNILALLVAVASAFGFSEFQPDSQVAEYALVIVTVVNIILHFVTNKALVTRKQ